ncbi:Uncharacterized protein dnl_63170 [Desulfonema limicola]|uniref:Small CPxCG-related zinc finger protein n=1 Tax=Desulfonema limicola TaxID=45656 RepID=A0A975GKK7_9BACT|nr:hypothetical protein [Desulfonema limicola]QTA83893.1 Uncharacterized protein dnl_63170 [Desulfonema limicola]
MKAVITNQCPECNRDIATHLTERYLDYPQENFKTDCPFCNAQIEVDAEIQFSVTFQQEYKQAA